MKYSSTVKSSGLLSAIKTAIDRGESPEQIANKAGLSASAVYNILNGGERVRLSNVARIASAINCDYKRKGDDVILFPIEESSDLDLTDDEVKFLEVFRLLDDKAKNAALDLLESMCRVVDLGGQAAKMKKESSSASEN